MRPVLALAAVLAVAAVPVATGGAASGHAGARARAARPGPAPAPLPGVVVAWQRDYEDGPRDHTLVGVAVDGRRLLVVAAVGDSRLPRLVFWRSEGSEPPGTPIALTRLAPDLQVGSGAAIPRGVALRPDGTAVVLVAANRVSWLAQVAPDGRITAKRQVGSDDGKRRLERLVAWPDGGVVLVGRDGDDAYAIRLDERGTPRWDRSEDRGRVERYGDAAPAAEGGAVLAGEIAEGGAATEVLVTAVDASGARGPTTQFPGRRPRLAAMRRGFAVVYQRAAPDGVALALRILDSRLSTTADVALDVRKDAPPSGDDAVPVPLRDGGLLVVATWGSEPLALRLDAAGRRRGTRLEVPGFEGPGAPEAVATTDGAIVAYPVVSSASRAALHRELRLLRLGLRDPR